MRTRPLAAARVLATALISSPARARPRHPRPERTARLLLTGQADADGDGVPDAQDICPGGDTEDSDADTTPDLCDVCPLDPDDDADGDGLCAEAAARVPPGEPRRVK